MGKRRNFCQFFSPKCEFVARGGPIIYTYRYPVERPEPIFFFTLLLGELTTMRTKMLGGLACLVAAAFISLPVLAADDDGDKKISNEQVMKDAFKNKLIQKVAKGEGSAEDAKNLHGLLVALSKNEPPKGDAESWKQLTGALVKASQGVLDGDKEAGAALGKAANCKACHSKHKP